LDTLSDSKRILQISTDLEMVRESSIKEKHQFHAPHLIPPTSNSKHQHTHKKQKIKTKKKNKQQQVKKQNNSPVSTRLPQRHKLQLLDGTKHHHQNYN
jgi:hypothetical protein